MRKKAIVNLSLIALLLFLVTATANSSDDTTIPSDMDPVSQTVRPENSLNLPGYLASSAPRSGNLMSDAVSVAVFPDVPGNGHPMSIAFDGTYYYAVGGGSTGLAIGRYTASFVLDSVFNLALDPRAIVRHPADGELYIKALNNNGLYRLHRSPFEGDFDTVFTSLFQDTQSDFCFSPDGTVIYDVSDSLVISYDFATGAKLDSFKLDMQHPIDYPRGQQIAHTGDYLLTYDSSKVYAYSPFDGSFVGSCNLPNGPYYAFSPAYTNGMYFIANDSEDSIYVYQIDDGVTSVREIDALLLPKNVSLQQNYPNPFNPSTEIRFSIDKPANVNLTVYNITGQKVAQLVDRYMSAGEFVATWDGRNEGGYSVASGVYFYRLTVDDFTETKKMVMLK